jgi:hypothetical protein
VQCALAYALASLSGLLAAEPPPCGAPADAGCAPAVPPSALDVLSVAAAPGCVAAAAVAALNRFVNPRRIVLLARTRAACARLAALAPNVQCLLEDEAVPGALRWQHSAGHGTRRCQRSADGTLRCAGVTYAAVASLLRQRYGASCSARASALASLLSRHTARCCAGLRDGATHYGRDTAGWYLQQARPHAPNA